MFSLRIDRRTLAIWGMVAAACLLAYALYPHYRQKQREAGVTEIVYWSPMLPMLFDAFKPVIAEFEKRNPQYRVQMGTATAQNTDDPTRLMLGVAGGMPPDVIYFGRTLLAEWASRGVFADLAPFIEQDKSRPDGVHKENFYERAWEEGIYNGKIYGVSYNLDTRVLYYAHDPLIRAGFIYDADDPEVVAGKAKLGDPRPPRTWEELCLKRLHAIGEIDGDGRVSLAGLVRRLGTNDGVPDDTSVDLRAAGVREGDVVALVKGTSVFRARIAQISGSGALTLDLNREQRPGLSAVPMAFRGECEVKIFDQDGYLVRLTRYDPETGQLAAAGFIPLFGNSWLYMFAYLNDAQFMNSDRSACTLDSPRAVEALQFITDMYDALGGVEAANVFQVSSSSGGLDPFFTGHLAMRIHTNLFVPQIMQFSPDLRFGVTDSPLPAELRRQGKKGMGWSGGFAFAIPATARNKEAAWELIRWLSSMDACKILARAQANIVRASGQEFFPEPSADVRKVAWLKEHYLDNNPNLPTRVVEAYDQCIDLLSESRFRPVTPVGQVLWDEQARATDAAIMHLKTPYEALNYGKRQVDHALDKVLHPPDGPAVPWTFVIGLYVATILGFFICLAAYQTWRSRGSKRRGHAWFEGYVAASPWLVGFAVFGAGPIIFSIIISFCHYDVLNPARFIGLDNYVGLLGRHFDEVVEVEVWNDPIFWKSLRNTLFMGLSVPLGITIGLLIALLLDTGVRGLHVYRTLFYLPAIVPAVATFILWTWIFEPSRGLLNQMLLDLGMSNPPNWLQDPFWAKPSLILMGLWGVGASMVIWLAGLKDIPESLYEAAAIDGANRIQRFFRVTLPLLTPYIFFNMVMGLIGVFQIFEAAFVMTNGGPADSTMFFAYKLFNEAFRYLNMGVASAMAWFLFLVVAAITLLQFWLAKRWVHYGG
ncbi:MAG: extracellular solute-binding protein [Nitrospiraceae bacterium]|nr:extracellular solute-binding protein [Nitrospiraceae bacterium]